MSRRPAGYESCGIELPLLFELAGSGVIDHVRFSTAAEEPADTRVDPLLVRLVAV